MPRPAVSHEQDLFLARRAAAGHVSAWDQLLRLYGKRIYNVAYQFAANGTDAEDLCQEIFLKLHQSLGRYRGEVPLIGWALRLSRNLCIDLYRRSRLERRSTFLSVEILETLPADDDPLTHAQRRQEIRLVLGILEEMAEDLATVLLLRDLQGWDYEEVAAALDLPLGTVKSRIHRGRRELSRRMRNRIAGGSPLFPTLLATSC